MINAFNRLVAFSVLTLSILIASGPARAADAFSAAQKEEINKLVHDYLLEHPDIIIQAIQSHQQREQEEIGKMAEKRIAENMAALTDKNLPAIGPADADVTIVEFYDYNCGYCKRALEDIQKIIDSDKKVRFIFKDLPVLGPTSELAARWSQAAHKQGKFFEFHKALMHNTGGYDQTSLEKLAKDNGLDVEQAKKDADSDEVKKTLDKSRQIAMEINIQGTPGFIVNGKLFPGYLGEAGLKKVINDARSEKAE